MNSCFQINPTKMFSNKLVITFIQKFLTLFLFFYLGTKLIIGLTYKNGIYVKFIDDYFNYVSWIKTSLIYGAQIIAESFGYLTFREQNYTLRIANGRGVIISQGCVGYGVMSFWIAFVLANKTKIKKKIIWSLIGLTIIWLINSIRIGLFLVSINKGWKIPLGIDHHTWFNIFAYIGIFILIYFFEKSIQKNES